MKVVGGISEYAYMAYILGTQRQFLQFIACDEERNNNIKYGQTHNNETKHIF